MNESEELLPSKGFCLSARGVLVPSPGLVHVKGRNELRKVQCWVPIGQAFAPPLDLFYTVVVGCS